MFNFLLSSSYEFTIYQKVTTFSSVQVKGQISGPTFSALSFLLLSFPVFEFFGKRVMNY